MECVTAASVSVTAAGKGSTVTAAAARSRACQRMARSAAAGGNVSVDTVSVLYPEHLGTSVRSAQHVETPVHLHGENTVIPSLLSAEQERKAEYLVSVTSVIGVFFFFFTYLKDTRYGLLMPLLLSSGVSGSGPVVHMCLHLPCNIKRH